MSKEYSVDLQKLFLEMLLHNAESYVRIQNIYNPENFDRSLRSSAKFIKEHVETYKSMPTIDQVKAITALELKSVPELNENHYDWFLDEFEKLRPDTRKKIRIVMLTSSINPQDFAQAKKYNSVIFFLNKPLTHNSIIQMPL